MMAANSGVLQAGYGNGGIEPMEQFTKLSDKIGNSLKNLEYTRDMIRLLAENEKKSSKQIATILNQKNKSLRFSVVDQAIQNYWKKQESNRRHFAIALQTKIVQSLDSYINSARDKRKKLSKENSKIQRQFIECKKETTKQKQIGLREWQKLEEQIQKNDQHKKTNKLGKIKDLKPLQDKCSKAFAKYESYVAKLNDLEQINHSQACKIGELLHESQRYAADRLSMHYNMVNSSKKYYDEFINNNKSIVQSKAPPLNDILWRWLTFPKNHQTHNLPCTSKEVFNKKSIGQSFQRRVEPDYQESKLLKQPKQSKKKRKDQKQKIIKKKVKKPKQIPPSAPTDDHWDVDFGANDDKNNNKNKNDNIFNGGTGNTMSDEDFFGADDNKENKEENNDNNINERKQDDGFGFAASFDHDDGNGDIFGAVHDIKQEPIQKKQEAKQKDLVQQHQEEIASNGFDAGFNNDFGDFGNNKDLNIANDNANNTNIDDGAGRGGGGFGDGWNTNFDENAFATDNNGENNQQQQNEEDVDQLFAASEANDIFGGDGGGGDISNNNITSGDGDGHDLFSNNFGGDDIFGNNNDKKIDNNNDNDNDDDNDNDKPPPPSNINGDDNDLFANNNDGFDFGDNNNNDNDKNINNDIESGGLFDDEFDDDQIIEFPEFDINAAPSTTTTSNETTKKRKSKLKKKKKEEPIEVQLSPQPNEITSIPEPVISFDAPQPSNKQSVDIDDDNPFGIDDDDDDDDNIDVDDDDNIDADNPFAMFDEPDDDNNNDNDNDDNNNNNNNSFDPFG